ncbi:MAG: polysaccharide export outer membrane protein [Rhodobacteraceae bacterium HLUCCA08]|nr:MAG: polysaccharide export outer membrane protein [Rhodobacteraceae bacterium HLUCCA08]
MVLLKRFLAGLWLVTIATTASAQSEYQVRAGDVLVIEVLEDAALNRSLVVLPDGRISFPFAGSLRVSGRTVGEVEQSITSAIASNFAAEPNVFVSVQPAEREPAPVVQAAPAAAPTVDIYFLGEVNNPGLKEVAPGTTFLQAIAQSGGMTRFAATKRVQLRRTDPTTGQQSIYEIDYRAIMDGAQMVRDIELIDGDVILVPERRLFE